MQNSARLHNSALIFVLVLTLILRVGIIWLTPHALESDPDAYRRLANNLATEGVFGNGTTPTAYRPPLYPLLLVFIPDRPGIAILHVLLGLATTGLTFFVARRMGFNNFLAALAALFVACDPILLNQSTQVMTETPATFLSIASLAALIVERHSCMNGLLCGILLGLGALCRPVLLLWAVIAVTIYCIKQYVLVPRSYKPSLAIIVGLVLTISPWAIRNHLQFGRPIVTTTHSGYTFLLANNPYFFQWLQTAPWGDVWLGDQFNADWDRRRPQDELAADRQAWSEGWQHVRQQPETFAYGCLVRLGRFWSPLPHRTTTDESPMRRLARYGVAIWYVLQFFLAGLGVFYGLRHVWKQPNHQRLETVNIPLPTPSKASPATVTGRFCNLQATSTFYSFWLFAIVMVLSLTAAQVVFWTDMRMRAPLTPIVAIAAITGLYCLLCNTRSNLK